MPHVRNQYRPKFVLTHLNYDVMTQTTYKSDNCRKFCLIFYKIYLLLCHCSLVRLCAMFSRRVEPGQSAASAWSSVHFRERCLGSAVVSSTFMLVLNTAIQSRWLLSGIPQNHFLGELCQLWNTTYFKYASFLASIFLNYITLFLSMTRNQTPKFT